jgi:hypothetical protein
VRFIGKRKETMQDMKERFGAMPTGSQVIVIDGVNYTVVSHYTGGKDIDHVIRALAEKQATAEMNSQIEKEKIPA